MNTNMSNFHPLEVVYRGSETQLQVDENLNMITDRVDKQMGQILIILHGC